MTDLLAFLQIPLTHGDIVEGAIDNSLWFRIMVAITCIWVVVFTGYVMRKMVTKDDLKVMLLELRREIDQEMQARFLSKEAHSGAVEVIQTQINGIKDRLPHKRT